MSIADYVRHGSKRKILQGSTPKWISNNKRARYIKAVVLSTPFWVKQSWIKDIEQTALKISDITKIKHVMDHIIPVNHPLVCGLTVPWNLRIITHRANSIKGNSCDEFHYQFPLEL